MNQRARQFLGIDQVLDRTPLTVDPEALTATVVKQMGQAAGQRCPISALDSELPWASTPPSGYALVIEDNHVLGIFTERDLVRLVAEGKNLEAVKIAEVMTQPVIAHQRSATDSIFTILTTLRQHRIRQLPIVDERDNLLGAVTQTTIRQAIHPFNFLKLRRIGEVMVRNVVQAKATVSLLALAQQMTQQRVSGVVITETRRRKGVVRNVPIGILTERDIVQFQTLGLSLTQTRAHTVMSTPLFLMSPQDTLWQAQQEMQQRHVRCLVVANEAGELAGIVTQTSLLQVLDPMEMLAEIEQLQQVSAAQTISLNEANWQLHQANQALQAEITTRQRLEKILQQANRVLEERLGLQAAQIVQTDETLKQVIQERQQAQMQLEQFFAVTPSLLCIAGLDGYFKRLNPSFARILGHSDSELLAHPFISFVHPDDIPATQAETERLATGALTLSFENRYRCRDGSYRWFSWNAIAFVDEGMLYAAARDVTAHKQLEQDLKQERNFISAVLDTASALVVVLDSSGKIVSFNRACEQASGYPAEAVRGLPIWEVLIPVEETAAVQEIFQQLKQTQTANQYENHWLSKSGERRLISWSNTLLKDAAGQVEYVIGTGLDVTERRQTEQTLARQSQQDQLLSEITRKIRESLNIEEILQTAVVGARKLLACDRVVLIEFQSNAGRVVQESSAPPEAAPSLLHQAVSGVKLDSEPPGQFPQVCTCEDLALAPCSLYTTKFLRQVEGRSCIEVAVQVGDRLWGIIVAIQCHRPRHWEAFENELMQQLANQMGVAIAQARLLDTLEAKVKQRTYQLSQTNRRLRQEIQERSQIETELLENQQKLAGILDNADEAIVSIDDHQRIVMYNQGAERIFGYAFEEVLNRPLDILLPDTFRQVHRQHIQNFAASADTSRQMATRRRDVLGRRKNGETFPAEASISKLQTKSSQLFTVILKDITEQRQSEIALRRSEARLRLTTNALPVLICSITTQQQYGFINQTYADWFQVTIAPMKGRYVWEIIGDSHYAQIRSYIEAALGGEPVSFETELTTPDGQSRCLMTTYTPEIDDQGQVKGLFGLSIDISDRKAAERMKDEFVSIVGHELRTPLSSIHGSLRLLASKKLGTLTPQGQEFLDISLKNTQRLTRLINDVLDLERMESGRTPISVQDCPVKELMGQAAQAMQAMADAHHVELVVTPLEGQIQVDPDHIIQVLTNLLSNAIKFSPADTTVRLSAIQRADDLLIQVQDQGRGIPPDKLETIFERFQQVDASDSRELGGTGLGLAICKNIVQQHNGKIWAESTLGSGSTFYFTLPQVFS